MVNVLDNKKRPLFRLADPLEISAKYRYLVICYGNENVLGENIIIPL